MTLTKVEFKRVQGKIDQSFKLMKQQEAGNFSGDPDHPCAMFLHALNKLVRNPINEQAHLDMLYKAIGFLMAEEPNPYTGTLEEAIDDAFDEAMDNAGPLQQALLALVRYRLKQQHLSA